MHPGPQLDVDPQALTRRIREGDAAAFEVVFRAYYAELCSFVAAQVGSDALAEELVQDVLLRVWQGRAQLDAKQSLRHYLYRAARNHTINHLKRRRLEDRWRDNAATAPARASSSTDEAVRTHELSDAIAETLATLPERCRLIFTMSREQGLSYADIAEVLDISVKTVETQMGRALKALRAGLATFFV
jgi:RNA polymerase sigma-70 factor (ECF subfamily)